MGIVPSLVDRLSPAPRAPRNKAPFSADLLSFTLCLLTLCSLALGTAGGALAIDPASQERVWITVGADAFEMLQHADAIQLDAEPLRAHQEHNEVVITQVHGKDLLKISELIHEYFHRCSGFMVHPDLDHAIETLNRQDAQRGATIEYLLDQQTTVAGLQPRLQAENIRETIERLSTDFNNRYYGHPSGQAAAEWIRDLWQGYATGREHATVELVQHSWTQPSVVLTIEGSHYPDEIVVLGGHLDSISSGSSNPDFLAPGADDNASGIATLSEVARVMLTQSLRPKRTVQFMGYAAEEVGLLGSRDIAAAYEASGTEVVAVLQLDMTAFNGSAEDIALLSDYTNSTLTSFVGQLVDTYQPELVRTSTACGYGCSDHASWHREGFPAAMAFEARFGQHNSSIHSTGDTLATLGNSGDHALKFARLGLAFAVEIGTDDLGEMFFDGFESGNLTAWSVVEP